MKVQAVHKKEVRNRKILIPGTCDKEVSIRNRNGWVKIRRTKSGALEFSCSGLIVAFNGGGDEPKDSIVYKDAYKLSRAIVDSGGLVLNGGRNTGIMLATGQAAGKMCLGVNFAAQVEKNKAHSYGKRLIVHPLTRLAILTWCPPIVIVYKGGLGTFHELVNALVAIKNQALYGLVTPKIYLSQFWRKPLLACVKAGVLPRPYVNAVVFFNNSDDVLKKISD